MKQLFQFVFLCLLVFTESYCQSTPPQPASREFTIGRLIFQLPEGFRLIKRQGIDSYADLLLNSQGDTFYIDYGNIRQIDNIFGNPPPVLPMSARKTFFTDLGKVPPPEEDFFSDDPEIDNREGTFLKEYYMYDTINTILLKLVQPKKIGYGRTGVIISNFKENWALSIYARDLDSAKHEEAIRIFRSVRYK